MCIYIYDSILVYFCFRNELNSKDKLYNNILLKLKNKAVGFTPVQVNTIGVTIVKTLTNALWYIDPHHMKFENRGIIIPEFFSQFKDYNDWRVQKKKEPMVWQTYSKLNIFIALNLLFKGIAL